MNLSKSLDKNIARIKKDLSSFDVIFHEVLLKDKKGVLIFIDSIKQLMTETWNTIVEHGAVFIEENSL